METNTKIKENSNNEIHTESKSFNDSGTYLITQTMRGVLAELLNDISDFKNPNSLKLKSIVALSYVANACKDRLEPHLDKILSTLYSYIIDEDINISKNCEATAIALGRYINQDLIIPLTLQNLAAVEIRGFNQSLYARLRILASVTKQIKQLSLKNAELILQTIDNLHLFELSDSTAYVKPILITIYELLDSVVLDLNTRITEFNMSSQLFYQLLMLGSLPETIDIHQRVVETLKYLANFSGFSNIESLYGRELKNVLAKFADTHKEWRRNSPDRFAFDMYVKNAGLSLQNNWREVLMIISDCCDFKMDIEMRIDMMILMENLIDNKTIEEEIKIYSELIIEYIILPSVTWQSQRPNYKVRKAALVCLTKIFRNNLIDQNTAIEAFKNILNVLKSAMEDDWDPELRYLALSSMKSIIEFINDKISSEQISELYPHLIKRLDDSQDANRVLVCQIFVLLFEKISLDKISEGVFDYIVSTAIIHMDDTNDTVRKNVFEFINAGKRLYPDTVLKISNKNLSVFKEKDYITKLIA